MSFKKQANAGNVHLVQGETGCCPDTAAAVCKHSFLITDLTAVTSITIDGNVHLIEATDETNIGQVIAAIQAAFEAEGYVLNGDGLSVTAYENTFDSTTAYLIYTNAESVVLTTVPAADSSVEACVQSVACRYHLEIPVPVAPAFTFDISDEDVEVADPANSPQTIAEAIASDFETGGADNLAIELETALIALYAGETNVTVKRVRIIENTDTGMYEVDFWLYGRHPIITNDVDLVITRCECNVDYTTAN